MKAAKEAVRANPEARALMEEARTWKGEDWERPEHYPSEGHQGFCPCDFCGQEIKERMNVTKTLTSLIKTDVYGEKKRMKCLVFDHEGRNTTFHTEIWSDGERLD